MYKDYWTSADLQKVFRFDQRSKSLQTLFNAEERGDIPKATRTERGSVSIRQWKIEDLPEIGKKFGFLKMPSNQIVLCIYAPKGGVLKTTFSYNLAKVLALNGIKTVIVDLDTLQGSITNYTIPPQVIESLDELEETIENHGLYHFLVDKIPLSNVIQKTNLPTLDIIPETPELTHLEMKIRLMPRREYLFKEKLIPALKDYQVVLFDNGSGLNQLAENALAAANNVIVPMGCEIEAFKAVDKGLSIIFDFKHDVKIEWDNFIQVPTLLEKTKLSQQIYAAYLNEYSDHIIPFPIRKSVKGQEARALNTSILEYDPKSDLAQDYYEAAQEIWNGRILKSPNQ